MYNINEKTKGPYSEANNLNGDFKNNIGIFSVKG